MLGSTGFLGWTGVRVLTGALLRLPAAGSIGFARALDALTLGEASALSLGIALPLGARGAGRRAGAGYRRGGGAGRAGGLRRPGGAAPGAPAVVKPTHGWLVLLAAAMGGVLLLAADVRRAGCWRRRSCRWAC